MRNYFDISIDKLKRKKKMMLIGACLMYIVGVIQLIVGWYIYITTFIIVPSTVLIITGIICVTNSYVSNDYMLLDIIIYLKMKEEKNI